MEGNICQSCGRIIGSEELQGTHRDGHRNADYCIKCYEGGLFSSQSIEEQMKAMAAEEGSGVHEKELMARLSGLKRWLPAPEQASWILSRCGYVVLSTISSDGYPQPAAVDVIGHDGIRTLWMTTFRSSRKAGNIIRTPKAGICFVREADSVTLEGHAAVIADKDILQSFWQEPFAAYFPKGPEDSDYCLIRFTSIRASCWIDGKKVILKDLA